MKTDKAPIEQLDAYLERLERRERARRRKKLLSIGLILACLGAGFIAFQKSSQDDETTSGQIVAQTDEQLRQASAIPVSNQGLIVKVDSSELSVKAAEETKEDNLLSRLPVMTVKYEGERKVGEELVYTIENFHPGYQLSLDFGNGIRRKAQKENRYTYPLSGYFDMRLLLIDGDSIRVLHTLNYQILPAEEKEESLTSDNSRFVDIPITRSMDPSKKSEITRTSDEDVFILDRATEINREPVIMADDMPKFPGGNKALNDYITRHVRYPNTAPIGRKGQVVVQFVVNTDGSLSDLLLLKKLGDGFDQEAIRLITQMPRWIPGKENGLRVPVYHKVIIPFRQAS